MTPTYDKARLCEVLKDRNQTLAMARYFVEKAIEEEKQAASDPLWLKFFSTEIGRAHV